MAKLYRPHVPLPVDIAVLNRHLEGYLGLTTETLIGLHRNELKKLVCSMKQAWANKLGCSVSDLRRDHDPPLGARPQERRGLGRKTYYIPDANDPDHLFYRPHGPQFDGSHLIKTNVRGDHGQHPDRVLIKKQRRLERGPKPKRGPKIKSRGFTSKSGAKLSNQKRKLPSRPFPKRSK